MKKAKLQELLQRSAPPQLELEPEPEPEVRKKR
eukprot:COSAG04_NODE_719_length_10829_cov_6.915750_13_plen_33_part_00